MALIDTRPQVPADPNRTRGPARQERPAQPQKARAPARSPDVQKPLLNPQEAEELDGLVAKRLSKFNGLTGPEVSRLFQLQQQAGTAPQRPAPALPHQEMAGQVPDPMRQALAEQLGNINALRDQAKPIGQQYRNVEASYQQLSELLPMVTDDSKGEALQQFNNLGDTMGALSTQMAELQGKITDGDQALNGQIAQYLKLKDPKFSAQEQKVQDLTQLTTALDNISGQLANGEVPAGAIAAYNAAIKNLMSQNNSPVSFADLITQREGSGHTGEELELIKEKLQGKLNTGRITYNNMILAVRQSLLNG